MNLQRLLFASTHSIMDPSSGAAIATRDLLELLVEHGIDCRAICGGVLDFELSTPLEAALETLRVPFRRASAPLSSGFTAGVLDLNEGPLRVTLVPTSSSLADRAPSHEEASVWLELAEQALDRFQPQVLLTYGGHPAGLELMRRARRRGIAVVFHLHNYAYRDKPALADANLILVPSEYAKGYYAHEVGLEATALPLPIRADRIVATNPERRFVTFVNPQPAKGVTIFARIAAELDRRRPEIPLLVVEGRTAALGLANYGLDLSGLTNLHRMANTPDPRDFYSVSRAVLVPSLWRESFGRVAAEALANGIPVLASDRGSLPEILGDAGFIFHIPYKYGPDGSQVPTAREVAPWVAAIEWLWDDPVIEATHQSRARAEAKRWETSTVIAQYREVLSRLVKNLSS